MLFESLTVLGNLESLDAIASFTIKAAELADLDRKSTYGLRLAVDEIATNIIQHGYREADPTGKITCSAELNEDYLTITLDDWGLSYNYREYARPDSLQQPLVSRPIGGLGIYLAIQSVDEFQYQKLSDRNRHILSVKR